jgi:hypothetical protein
MKFSDTIIEHHTENSDLEEIKLSESFDGNSTDFEPYGFSNFDESLREEIDSIEDISEVEDDVNFSQNDFNSNDEDDEIEQQTFVQNEAVLVENTKSSEYVFENFSVQQDEVAENLVQIDAEENIEETLELKVETELEIPLNQDSVENFDLKITSQPETIDESETPEFDAFFSELIDENFFDDSHEVASNSSKSERNTQSKNDTQAKTENLKSQSEQINSNAESGVAADSQLDGDWAEYAETIGQIGSIKTIDQIFAAIERDQLGLQVKQFDSLDLNMALQDFRRGNFDAKDKVFDEILKWQDELLERDQNISVHNLRLHCETAKPALNSKALLTLGEFYQNVSRSKFEMLLTRVFSRISENSHRRLILEDDELEQHIINVFAKNQQEIVEEEARNAVVSKLAQFRSEASECTNFGGLIATELFRRYSQYKSEIGSEFNDSKVLKGIIETNVFIGERLVKLIIREKSSSSGVNLADKTLFGEKFEEEVATTVCQTICLDNIVLEAVTVTPKKQLNATESTTKKPSTRKYSKVNSNDGGGTSVGKLIVYSLIACVITLIVVYVSVTYLMNNVEPID